MKGTVRWTHKYKFRKTNTKAILETSNDIGL